jgi:hypothetical protein
MRLGTSENIFLTFLVDLGFPFTLIYCGVLVLVMKKLVGVALYPLSENGILPLAILVALSGELIHYLLFDGLFHPQCSWFFHVLLGMAVTVKIPNSAGKDIVMIPFLKVIALCMVLIAGAVVGFSVPL